MQNEQIKSPSFGIDDIDNSVQGAAEINIGLNKLNLLAAAENQSSSSAMKASLKRASELTQS